MGTNEFSVGDDRLLAQRPTIIPSHFPFPSPPSSLSPLPPSVPEGESAIGDGI